MGYEMTDTVIGFTKEKMVVITSKTKAEFLRPIIDGAKVQSYWNLTRFVAEAIMTNQNP